MIPAGSEDLLNQLVDSMLKHATRRMEAVRILDVPRANSEHLKASAAADRLAASPEGKLALEALLSHQILHIRVSAAEKIIRWSPDLAIPVLGSMLDADLSNIPSPDERLDIRIRAKDMLYLHFGIRSHDRNDLIEPLAAYGIELGYRRHEDWQ